MVDIPRVDLEPAAVSARDGLSDEEAEAQPVTASCVTTARTKGLEDARQELTRDRALVVDLDGDALRITRQSHVHRGARGAVLHGVGGEVRQRLQDAVLVPGAFPIDLAIQSILTVAHDSLELVDDLPAHGAQIGWLRIDGNARTISLSRQIQQVSHDVLDAFHSAADHLRVLLHHARGIIDVHTRLPTKPAKARPTRR